MIDNLLTEAWHCLIDGQRELARALLDRARELGAEGFWVRAIEAAIRRAR